MLFLAFDDVSPAPAPRPYGGRRVAWQDIDPELGTVSVRRTVILVHVRPVMNVPKTKLSRRTIQLDSRTLAVPGGRSPPPNRRCGMKRRARRRGGMGLP